MKSKFLFFTDTHFNPTPPSRYRRDIYPISMLAKLDSVIEKINKYYDFGVFGGDWFESHQVKDLPLLIGLVVSLKKLEKPIYYIWGNHDIKGYNKNSRKDSSFFVLATIFPKLKIIKPNHEIKGMTFVPVHAWNDIPRRNECNMPSVMVAHKMITPSPQKYTCHPIQTFKVKQDVLLSGDFHGAFNEKIGDTIFANPGSLARRRRGEKHKPSYLSVEFNGKEFNVSTKTVPHLEYDEVFSEIKEEEEKVKNEVFNEELEEFSKSVRDLEVSAVDIFDLIELLVRNGSIKVSDKILNYLVSKR